HRDNGHIGCGGIIRGSEGEWLGGFVKFIKLHVDSMVVVRAITVSGGGSTCERFLVEKIRRLIDLDWEVVVKHSYREANQCRDALANIVSGMTDGCVFYDKCPIDISHIYPADVLGIATPRLVPF
ncbi:putative non-LTR retroelement reverse transcriptase, partial [Trifolium medium]|nr:putative non-LTR retroelement reverse transcriptase [Trifolium medium]